MNQLVLPGLVSFDLKVSGWKIYFEDSFVSFLVKDEVLLEDVDEKLDKMLNSNFDDFRVQITIKSTSFLAGVFYSDKEVRLYTPRLGQELFLIQEIQKADLEHLKLDIETFHAFKAHTEKVAALEVEKFPSVYELNCETLGLTNLLIDEGYQKIEGKMGPMTKELLKKTNEYRPNWFEKVSDYGLGLTAKFALIRIHLLKFVAILPSLDHDIKGEEVKRTLEEAQRRLLLDSNKARVLKKQGEYRALPKRFELLFKISLFFTDFLPSGIVAKLVRFKIRFMAKRFIAGESIKSAKDSIASLSSTGRDVTVDQLGELVVSEKEANQYEAEVISLIHGFHLHYTKGEKNGAGINRAHVSIKVSALCDDFKPEAFYYTYEKVAPRLRHILIEAKEHDVFINIDAEHYHYRDVVFGIYKKVLFESTELQDYAATGIVVQAYLRDSYIHLKEIIDFAKERGHTMPIRLVKGAYWDAETIEADAHGFDAPEFLNKEETDLNFRNMVYEIFKGAPHIQLCLASHNYSDHVFSEVLREETFPKTPVIEHQCLHMTYEALSVGMAKMGWTVRNYVPIGSLIVGMAYLVRRIMENSSQVGVLTIMRSHKKKSAMKTPTEVHFEKKDIGALVRDQSSRSLTEKFFNVPVCRLYIRDEGESVRDSVYNVRDSLGQQTINVHIPEGIEKRIYSPSDPEKLVGITHFATLDDAKDALEKSHKKYNEGTWAKSHFLTRASILLRVANLMYARRSEFAGMVVYESGKNIYEALGDVDEAIDFLNFYAREEALLGSDESELANRGVVVSITPWNFPLAIPCGMIAAPLVAGNTVILKSAEQTPLIAGALVNLFYEAGLDHDVLIHLPGEGEVVGQYLVESPKVSTVVFTGSKAVGLRIQNIVSRRTYHNELFSTRYQALAVTEMGGKNAIIVTENAELDETVAGIIYSGFAHAGQKCSACSRVLVSNAVKGRLIERLSEALNDIKVGKSDDYSTFVNPLVSMDEKNRLLSQMKDVVLEAQKTGGLVHVDRTNEEGLPGACVGPALIEIPYANATKETSFAQRELFAPVVHIIGYDTKEEAVSLFNSTEYALTGGVFSQSQDHIDYYTSQMESGNIYVNRSITGARVAIEPFGGFKLSGTGPKAGSSNYVSLFHVPILRDNFDNLKALSDGEDGSDYAFELCRPSGLSTRPRVRRVTRGMNEFLASFESLYQGIYGDQKDTLKGFVSWCKENAHEFETKERPNRIIPGQLSYNSLEHACKHTIFISYTDRPDFRTLIYFFSALIAGTGVTVTARTESSYAWWSRVRDMFIRSGISFENLDVYFSSKARLIDTFDQPELGMIVVDGNLDRFEEIAQMIYDEDFKERVCRKVLTPFDAPHVSDFESYISRFKHVRSFAINTMRHGAPMSMEL